MTIDWKALRNRLWGAVAGGVTTAVSAWALGAPPKAAVAAGVSSALGLGGYGLTHTTVGNTGQAP